MVWTEVFIGLGGNVGDTLKVFSHVVAYLQNEPTIKALKLSPVYETTPVGGPPQRNYLNAVCAFITSANAEEIREILVAIETRLGKETSALRNAPRIIDLDILLFGTEQHHTVDLKVPHPRWSERLFVLKPLADLIETLDVPQTDGTLKTININDLIATFSNKNDEVVSLYEQEETPCTK